MSKEIQTKNAGAVVSAEQAAMMDAFDYGQVEARDLKIPKLLLMQAMSKFVNEDQVAKSGDLVNSISAEVYGAVREKDYKPVKVIPIHMFKNWVIQEELSPGKFEYRETVPVTPQNTDWEWDVEVDGRKFKRTKQLNFYVLLEKDLGNPLALPHVISFRSTSFKEGGVLANHFATCKAAQAAKQFRIPMDRFFEIGGKMQKNEKGTFYVLTAKESGPTDQAAQLQAFSWYKQIQDASKAGSSFDEKVDNSEFAGTVSDSYAASETEF